MDIKFPLSVKNGDIEVTDQISSQFLSYVSSLQGESILEPSYGRVTDVQTSTYRSMQLVQQLEKYNSDQYFADRPYAITASFDNDNRRLNLKFRELE